RKAATRIGRLIRDKGLSIDLVLCSTSVRTRETAKRVFEKSTTAPNTEYRDDLYCASPEQIAQILSQVFEPAECVMVIGHNPGFEELFGQLTAEPSHFPTAGLAQ